MHFLFLSVTLCIHTFSMFVCVLNLNSLFQTLSIETQEVIFVTKLYIKK